MNRLKLWLYMVVVLGAAAANLYLLTTELSERALSEADGRLGMAAAQLRERERFMASEAAAVAGLAVRNGALLEALYASAPKPTPEADARKKGKKPAVDEARGAAERQAAVEAAAKAAVEQAAATLSIDLPTGTFWVAASPEWLLKNPTDAATGPQMESTAFLREAATGTPRRGYARVNDSLWYGVAYQAGDGAALVVFMPLDAAWAGRLARATGVDVTLDVGTPQLVTTAKPEVAKRVAAAAVGKGPSAVSEGRIERVQLDHPVRFAVPILFVQAPVHRALVVPLTGLAKANAVLSVTTAGFYLPLARNQWTVVLAIAALFVVGLLLGVLVQTEVAPQVPAELLAAASKIERGDLSIRAPTLAGKFGTIAGALNKAVELAQLGQGSAGPGDDPFASQAAQAMATFGSSPPPTPTSSSPIEAREPTNRLDGGAFPAMPQPRPAPAAPAHATSAFGAETFAARPAAPPPRPTVQVTAMPPPTTSMGMPAAVAEESEEDHWRAVHTEFLKVRAQCGETTDGLAFDRFRPKLEKNKEQLVQKYGCKTVRFSVYVKDGKAALKATPVR